jgi:two-component system response regulator
MIGEDQKTGILLVEDDPKDIRLALHALKDGNLANHVEVVRDGEEALDYIFYRGTFASRSFLSHPQLILLDLKLPKIHGLQVLQEIKSCPQTKSIPVAILTSSREERDLVESYRLGVNSFIQKPIDFEQFRQTIKALGYYWLVVNQAPPFSTFSPEGPAI